MARGATLLQGCFVPRGTHVSGHGFTHSMFSKTTLGLSSLTKIARNRHKYYIRLLQSWEPVVACTPGFWHPGVLIFNRICVLGEQLYSLFVGLLIKINGLLKQKKAFPGNKDPLNMRSNNNCHPTNSDLSLAHINFIKTDKSV